MGVVAPREKKTANMSVERERQLFSVAEHQVPYKAEIFFRE